jgi:enoyl-CoA hydratase/carnithine racemase
MTEQKEVLYDVKGHIATITLNRPERRNAINEGIINGMNEGLDQADRDPAVSVVILTGSGGHFCSGADLGGRGFGDQQSFLELHEDRGHYAQMLLSMNTCRKPILAAIEGYCLAGGMGLCLASDLAIAHEDAQFGTPEIKRGLWPYMVTGFLIRSLGRKKALELCLTGERISAAEAERIGLINYAVPKNEFKDRIGEMAAKLASLSPAILGLGKRSFYQMADMGLEDSLEFLKSQLTINAQTEDIVEGVTAFIEKREPKWKGR